MANRHVVSGKESKMADGNPAYSSAVVSGNTIYLAGVTSGRDANGQVVGKGDIEKQVIAVMENIKSVLTATGATFADLTKVTVFATKPEYRAKIGEIRARYFSQPPPASTFVVISGLADPDFLVEIEATAVKG
jgi:2-iminobutanoate/2-iminopropanoate deaminase